MLEPIGFAPARTYQKELFHAGIPFTSFGIDNVEQEYERLKNPGVSFHTKPIKIGSVTVAVFKELAAT